MRRYFFLSTLLAASILFADEKNPFPSAPLLSSLDSEPSCVIDGCVNVILGSFFDYEEDLAIQGPEKLSVERLLINNNPNSMSDAFLQAPEWVFGDCQHLSRGCESYHCSYYGGLGELLHFGFKTNKTDRFAHASIIEEMLRHGQTNNAQGVIGAQTNIRHNQLELFSDTGKMTRSNGAVLKFKRKKYVKHSGVDEYLLREEEKPNYLRKIYSYDKEGELAHVELKTWGNTPLSLLNIKHQANGELFYQANDGRFVTYKFSDYKIKGKGFSEKKPLGKLERVVRSDKPEINYEYTEGDIRKTAKKSSQYFEWPHVCRKSYPDNRFIQVDYYDADECLPKTKHDQEKKYFKRGDVRPDFCRVKMLRAPLGCDAEAKSKYHFFYNISLNLQTGGTTSVFDALIRKTDYTYNKQERLTSITKYDASHAPYT